MSRDDEKRIKALGWLKLLQEQEIYQSAARLNEQNDRLSQLRENQAAIQEELVALSSRYENQISKESLTDPNYLASIGLFIHQVKVVGLKGDLETNEQEITVGACMREVARSFIRGNVLSVALEEERELLRQGLYTKDENSLSDIRSQEKALYQVDESGN